jgi:hypothetical protein
MLRGRLEWIVFAAVSTVSERARPNWQELLRVNAFPARATGNEVVGIEN